MTERICEGCGKQFVSELLWDKLEDAGLILAIPCLPLYGLHLLSQGWVGVVSAPINVLLGVGAFFEFRKRDRRRTGQTVVFGRKCPSCGEPSADIESPRGESVKLHWSAAAHSPEPEQTPPTETPGHSQELTES
jgi:hypothetical protein